MKSSKKGFTLIELMVVIVIIGILSALAIPKMFGVTGKAKAAEVPTAMANFETLQSAYVQETGAIGPVANIGYTAPTSKWWNYNTGTAGTLQAHVQAGKTIASGCTENNGVQTSTAVTAGEAVFTHAANGGGSCMTLMPNFAP